MINLTAGRNPWKQATMRNASFASYVRHPRHFFRTILPTISEDLERILLRIFCLNPAKRISLPELRHYIQKCPSFVATTAVAAAPVLKTAATTTSYRYHHASQQQQEKQDLLVSKNTDSICKKAKVTAATNQTATRRKLAAYNMNCSDSIAQTMLYYVGSYTDE